MTLHLHHVETPLPSPSPQQQATYIVGRYVRCPAGRVCDPGSDCACARVAARVGEVLGKPLAEALRELAKQKLPEEMPAEDPDYADYLGAYVEMVRVARAALKAAGWSGD